jgi:hypothetical protein
MVLVGHAVERIPYEGPNWTLQIGTSHGIHEVVVMTDSMLYPTWARARGNVDPDVAEFAEDLLLHRSLELWEEARR